MSNNKKDKLKKYREYWSNIEADEGLHKKLMAIEGNSLKRKSFKLGYTLAACCGAFLILISCYKIYDFNRNNLNDKLDEEKRISGASNLTTDVKVDMPEGLMPENEENIKKSDNYASLDDFLMQNPNLFEKDYEIWLEEQKSKPSETVNGENGVGGTNIDKNDDNELRGEVVLDNGKYQDRQTKDLKQIQENKMFGKYFPDNIKGGFTAREGMISDESAMVNYTRGYDYVDIRVEKVNDNNKSRVVDINNPETYDMSLYSIPLCDSVPQEFIETVNNPVFKADDINRDILARRIYTINDSGDTNGIRMNFEIMYDDIVVTYSVKGIDSADIIFDLLEL